MYNHIITDKKPIISSSVIMNTPPSLRHSHVVVDVDTVHESKYGEGGGVKGVKSQSPALPYGSRMWLDKEHESKYRRWGGGVKEGGKRQAPPTHAVFTCGGYGTRVQVQYMGRG